MPSMAGASGPGIGGPTAASRLSGRVSMSWPAYTRRPVARATSLSSHHSDASITWI